MMNHFNIVVELQSLVTSPQSNDRISKTLEIFLPYRSLLILSNVLRDFDKIENSP